MAVTLLTLPEGCRDRILHMCLLQHARIIVDSSHCDIPGLLRTCTQLRKEGTTMFYRKNTFLLVLENLALPQGHWIHRVAEVSEKPVITRMREQKEPPGSPHKWLSAFYNGKTKIQWLPFRPASDTRSKHTLVNVLGNGFSIASLLRAYMQKKRSKRDSEEDKKRQRSAELVLAIWCETAKTTPGLEQHLRVCEGRDFYRNMMESLDAYHYNPCKCLPLDGTRAKTRFNGAFCIVDIMQDDDWQVVRQVLKYWIKTLCTESVVRLCVSHDKAVTTARSGPRHRNPHWLRVRRTSSYAER